uniref:Uncharacterized protein n=1 Tax=Panagrolaimus sp. JU765 TaxID=591449 RepID=A0AC34R8M8_9BILA
MNQKAGFFSLRILKDWSRFFGQNGSGFEMVSENAENKAKPLATQMVSSGIIGATGDVICQFAVEKR